MSKLEERAILQTVLRHLKGIVKALERLLSVREDREENIDN